MSSRPTNPQLTGSVGPNTQASLSYRSGSPYVEFYLAAVWTWTDSGCTRLRSFMESLNVYSSTYSFDPDLQAVKVRCPRDSKDYIRRKFSQLIQEIENEYQQSGQKADVAHTDGTLTNVAHHPDVRLPGFLPNTRRLAVDQASRSYTSASVGGDANHSGGPTMSLVVPGELRNSLHIVVWQDLQGNNQDFEGTHFFSPAAKAAIESAHEVQIIVDAAQKVIFIGSSASLDAAKLAKARLTRLLQHHWSSRKVPSISRHIFYVESPTVWTIDTREVTQINPVLASSTILDPWVYPVPEQYNLFHGDPGVFALRVCMEQPLRSRQRNKTWSLFGPRARNVFNGQRAQRSSRFFNGLRAVRRRASKPDLADDDKVGKWAQKLDCSTVGVNEATLPIPKVAIRTQTTLDIGEDDPIPLHFDPSRRPNAAMGLQEQIPFTRGSGGATTRAQQMSLLDQEDAVLHDPNSTLQRAMKPSQRVIMVPDPGLTELESPSQHKEPCRSAVDPSSRGTTLVTARPSNEKESNIFVTSISRLMKRLRGRCGVFSIRAELGRYYACNVPESGRALNKQNEPASGWEPGKLREKMDENPSFMFTKALTSWGNDIDFLGATMWKPLSRTLFLDFYFEANVSQVPMKMVLEVNAEDYTWRIRQLDNIHDVVYIHCLAHHWDFRVPITYDCPLECPGYLENFAEALIESLDVTPPELEFRHTFSDLSSAGRSPSIVVQDVRVRQVCRLQHQNQKTYLDIDRIIPTKVLKSCGPQYHRARAAHVNSTVDNPSAGDDPETGEFAQWYEASVSSVRLEELLQQNQVLVPGDETDWTVQQIEQEQLLTDLYQQAAEVVKGMDGIGVECDNGHELRRPKTEIRADYIW